MSKTSKSTAGGRGNKRSATTDSDKSSDSDQPAYRSPKKFMDDFKQLKTTSNLLSISEEAMKELLDSDDLKVKSETEVCETLMRWLKVHKDAGRKVHPEQLLKFIRWSDISVEYVRSTLLQSAILTSNSDSIAFLTKVITYLMSGVQFEGLRTSHRKSIGLDNYLIIVGLGTNAQAGIRDPCIISLQHPNGLKILEKVPSSVNYSTAACRFQDSVYVVGVGGESNQKVLKWNAENGWTNCANMPEGRESHCAAIVDSTLYVLGGSMPIFDKVLKRVESYNIRLNKWSPAGRLTRAVKSAACVTYRNFIYLFGGIDKKDSPVDHIQVYNPASESCTRMDETMPTAEGNMRAVLWGSTVILLDSCHCYLYDLDAHTWETRDQFKTKVDDFAVALDNSTIYIAGGCTEEEEENEDGDDKLSSSSSSSDSSDDDDDGNLILTDEVKSVSVLDIINNQSARWENHAKLHKAGYALAYVPITLPIENGKKAQTLKNKVPQKMATKDRLLQIKNKFMQEGNNR